MTTTHKEMSCYTFRVGGRSEMVERSNYRSTWGDYVCDAPTFSGCPEMEKPD
ncbi:MAG: hypothetical protein V4473_01585 [Patescibacteria group bacterium]